MSESNLTLAFKKLRAEVGAFLGYGRGEDDGDPAYDDTQAESLKTIIRSGLRQFYYPPLLPGERSVYEWSFLKPVTSLTFASGDSTVRLPDDFGGIEGFITVSPSSTTSRPWPLRVGDEAQVRQQYARLPTSSGPPQLAGVQAIRGVQAGRSNRFELYIWPLADQAYTLQVQYYLIPDATDGSLPYAYGGAVHAETLLESCLSIAEQRLDDTIGLHTQKFMERLGASIAADRKCKPIHGYNGDRSDVMDTRRNYHGASNWGGRLYEGVQY